VCNDKDHGRSRRPSVEDRGWSHRSGTRWPGGREVRKHRVRSAPDTWRLVASASSYFGSEVPVCEWMFFSVMIVVRSPVSFLCPSSFGVPLFFSSV
jgi:hypothetical protein